MGQFSTYVFEQTKMVMHHITILLFGHVHYFKFYGFMDFILFFLKWFVIIRKGEIVGFLAFNLKLINFN